MRACERSRSPLAYGQTKCFCMTLVFLAVNNPSGDAEQSVNTSSSCLYRRKNVQSVHVVKHLGDGFTVTLP